MAERMSKIEIGLDSRADVFASSSTGPEPSSSGRPSTSAIDRCLRRYAASAPSRRPNAFSTALAETRKAGAMPWPLSAAWPNANDRSADWAPGAFRRSELVALDVADIAESKDGLLVTIRRSKTDQEGDDLAEQSPRGKCLMSHYRRCHRAGRPAP